MELTTVTVLAGILIVFVTIAVVVENMVFVACNKTSQITNAGIVPGDCRSSRSRFFTGMPEYMAVRADARNC